MFITSFGIYLPLLNNLENKCTTFLSLVISSSWYSILLESLTALETPNNLDLFLTCNPSHYFIKLYFPLGSTAYFRIPSYSYIASGPNKKAIHLGLYFRSVTRLEGVFSYFQWSDYCFHVMDPSVCA